MVISNEGAYGRCSYSALSHPVLGVLGKLRGSTGYEQSATLAEKNTDREEALEREFEVRYRIYQDQRHLFKEK